jgi:hypothetical protein
MDRLSMQIRKKGEEKMKKEITFLLTSALILVCASGLTYAAKEKMGSSQTKAATMSTEMKSEKFEMNEMHLKMTMRKLWEDHITFTRCYIVSSLAGLDDASAVADRLMKNQQDIGNAIKPFFGDAAGDQLAKLLKEHISEAADVVAAAKSGNKSDLTKAQAKWHKNADDIATFLSNANSNWPKKEMTDMLYKHLDYTTDEVVARLNKNWNADIAAYDKGHDHMLMFADMLSKGIIKKFPEKLAEQ